MATRYGPGPSGKAGSWYIRMTSLKCNSSRPGAGVGLGAEVVIVSRMSAAECPAPTSNGVCVPESVRPQPRPLMPDVAHQPIPRSASTGTLDRVGMRGIAVAVRLRDAQGATVLAPESPCATAFLMISAHCCASKIGPAEDAVGPSRTSP